jgi:hypothetical protein
VANENDAPGNGHGDNPGHGGGNPGAKVHIFFIGKEKFETELAVLTGAQIKARASNVEPGDGLSLEGQGHDPDRMIADDEPVQMDSGHGPLRFTIVPQANFG